MSGVDFDGNEIRKGAADAMQSYVTHAGGMYSPDCDRVVKSIASKGGTPLVVAKNHKILGVIYLKDIIKQGVKEKFADLRKMGMQFIMTISKNGRDSSYNGNLYFGTNVAAGSRSTFVNADTMRAVKAISVSASKPTVRLKVDEDAGTLKSVEFKSSVPNSLTMVQDANDPTIVTVTAKQALPYDNSYVTAVITRVDGSQSSAYVQLNWTSSSPYQYLPNGMRMVFGEKGESQDYHEFNGTTWTQSSNSTDPVVKKLYVFFTTYANGATKYYDTLDTVDTLTVTSSDNTNAMVTRQGRENGTYFFEYQLDLAKLGNYTFTATMTATTGETYTAQFELRVCENARCKRQSQDAER